MNGGAPEERARAALYGVLARLWLGPPDDALRRAFDDAAQPAACPGAAPGTAELEAPWRALVDAMRGRAPAQLADEHDALFHGVGRPDVFACGSWYLAGYLHERPLAALRADLDALGIARDADRGETEDHVAFLFEAMRWLVEGDDDAHCTFEGQRLFFRAHLQPWIGRLCDAVDAHPRADAWRAVSAMTRAFVDVERQAFDLFEA